MAKTCLKSEGENLWDLKPTKLENDQKINWGPQQ